jgi:hypothetical protein
MLKMNKIDSIIFHSDDGPVTSLFQKDTTPEDSAADLTDYGQHPRTVRFLDSEVFEEEKRSLSDHSMESDLVQVLKERLAEVQADLKMERAIRKRKDKNLVKLAKELNRRTSEVQEKEEVMDDMAARIKSMESTLTKQLLSYRDVSIDNESKIAAFDESIMSLRMQLAQATSESSSLRAKLREEAATHMNESHSITKLESLQPRSMSERKVWIALSSLACILFSSSSMWFSPISMNGICSPAMPGSFLSHKNNSGAMMSPWWAHRSFKDQAFDMICHGTPRTQISWKGDKIIVHSVEIDGKNGLLQRHAPLGVKIGFDEVVVYTKNGFKAIQAPWSNRGLSKAKAS